MADDLYDIRNALLLKNYPQVISDGASFKANPYRKAEENEALLAERDALVYKANVGMGQYDIVLDELSSTGSANLQAIRMLAHFMKADAQNNEALKSSTATEAKELLKSSEKLAVSAYAPVAITVATILVQNEDLQPALKCLRSVQAQLANTQSNSLLECYGLIIDILLRIHRPDQAEKEYKQMANVDDDATVSQLSCAYVMLAQGGDKLTEAAQIFDDLREKFGNCNLLLNGLALAQMGQGSFDTAEKLLLDSMSKSHMFSTDAETLINLITCSQHLKKPVELVNRYVTQLKSSAPNHPWVRMYAAMENKFETYAKNAAVA